MRYNDFKTSGKTAIALNEAEARIQHAEDVVFWEGSAGAVRALESLRKLEKGGHNDVTIKWDGSPASIFGRNEDGKFILTDKSGFGAKGYDGKSKSAKDLEAMLLNRKTSKGLEVPDSYTAFASNMRQIFDEYQSALPERFRGYFKGDLLYFNKPALEGDDYVFTPNIVTYRVDKDSDIGNKIGRSTSAVVIHRYMGQDGIEKGLQGMNINNIIQGDKVLVVPPVVVQRAPEVSDTDVDTLKTDISKYAVNIDTLLNTQTLANLKMVDMPKIFYAYLNSKVDTGLTALGEDFMGWLNSNTKISDVKKKRMSEHITQNIKGFRAMWQVVSNIMNIKNKIINQFDSHDADIKANIGDTYKGGEGYVLQHPGGDIKLVNRAGFTAANRSIRRD